MGHHSTNRSWNIWDKTRCHCGTEGQKFLPDNCPYDGRVDTKELEKI